MFNLSKHVAKVIHLSIRIERHGDERKPAADVKLVVDLPAEALNDIHPGLCESLYRKPAAGDQIALIDKKSDKGFTVVRHPSIEPLQIKQKFPGYELSINTEAQGEDVFLADAEIKNFLIKTHEGGTATVTFTASSLIDRDDIAALLDFLEREDATVTLDPPTKQEEMPHATELAA
jgi:hypothetical protein